ncbi:MAG: thiosulfate oxidation carrier protein SoxY, partial [Alphaproteobacteria bacterium]|nr:thiosulfate oxidation carrier protein SoxY [Alphaproteobacteria bacterium]
AGASLAPVPAAATPAAAAAELAKLIGGKPTREGRIDLNLPSIAENGNAVPLTVRVESPMSEADHVRAIHIVADGNPLPGVASFRFSPQCGKAEVTTRVRLAETQTVTALAEMSDGSLWRVAREVKVTIGGCGG